MSKQARVKAATIRVVIALLELDEAEIEVSLLQIDLNKLTQKSLDLLVLSINKI